MTTIPSSSWRSANTFLVGAGITVGLILTLSGCATTGLGGPGDQASAPPLANVGDDNSIEPEITAAQLAASECFPGIWEMDGATMGSLLVKVGLLVSESIEETSLLVVQDDGTLSVEHVGWTYVVKAPPNPILGNQAPKTTTITNDSSLSATYGIDEAGIITVTLDDDGTPATANDTPRALTCENDKVTERVEDLDGTIVFHRRG